MNEGGPAPLEVPPQQQHPKAAHPDIDALETVAQYAVGMAGLRKYETLSTDAPTSPIKSAIREWSYLTNWTEKKYCSKSTVVAATVADVNASLARLREVFAAADLMLPGGEVAAALVALDKYAANYNAFTSNVRIGSIVFISGLQSRSDLNGSIGVVREARGERWGVFSMVDASSGKAIGSMDPSNLDVIPHTHTTIEGNVTALLLAIVRQRETEFHALVYTSDVNRVGRMCFANGDPSVDGERSPLMLAAEMGNVEMVRTLLHKNADVTATTSKCKLSALSLIIQAVTYGPGYRRGKMVTPKAPIVAGDTFISKVAGWAGLDGIATGINKVSAFKIIEMLLEHNADPNHITSELEFAVTPLCKSVMGQFTDITNLLLQYNADPNLPRISNMPYNVPLTLAAANRDIEMAESLLKHGAEPDQHQVGHEDDEDASVALTKFAFTMPALVIAVNHGDDAMVSLLLAYDADANISFGKYGMTALIGLAKSAGCSCDQLNIAQILLDHGADVNKSTNGVADDLAKFHPRSTAFHHACCSGNIEMVTFLMENNANIMTDAASTTEAIHHAAKFGHLKVLQILLANDTDPNLRCKMPEGFPNVTPLMMAACGCRFRAISVHIACAGALLAGGADVNARDGQGRSALEYAAGSAKCVEMVEFLLKNNADANGKSTNHKSALAAALLLKDVEMTKLLLAFGANPSQTHSVLGSTALLITLTKSAKIELHQLLAIHGASSTALIGMQPNGKRGYATVNTPLMFCDKWYTGRSENESISRAWFQTMQGNTVGKLWSPIMIAAFAGMPGVAASALKLGRIDPEGDAAILCLKKIDSKPIASLDIELALIADALCARKFAKENGCKRTIDFVQRATSGWSPKAHWIHHRAVREAVHTVLLVAQRLRHKSDTVAADNGDGEEEPEGTLSVPPPELWLFLLGFCLRRDWPVEIAEGSCVEINGLTSRPELNGRKGVVQSKKGARWVVQTEIAIPTPAEMKATVYSKMNLEQAERRERFRQAGMECEFSIDVHVSKATCDIVALKPVNLTAVSSQHLFYSGEESIKVQVPV